MPDELKPGWRRVKFGEIVHLNRDSCKDPSTEGLERYVGLEHIEPGDLRIRSWGYIADGTTFTNRFRPGQVLFGKRRAYQRKIAVAEFDGVCSGDIYVFESRDPSVLLPDLLPFLCQTDAFFDHAVGTSAGSLSPRTNWSSLAGYQLALPPLEEQQKLLRVLSRFEQSLKATEALSNSADKLRYSLMLKHFGSPHPSYRKVSEIGKWYSGGTPSRANAAYWNGQVPWVSPKDMKISELKSAAEMLTPEGVEAGSRLVPEDTIMIVVRGMILAHTFPVARTLVPIAFNQDMKALVVSEEYRPKYIQYWFEHAAPRYLQLVSDSSHGTKRLESDKLLSLAVPQPGLDEQDNFIGQVDGIRSAANDYRSRQIKTMRLKRYFLHEKLMGR